MSDEIPDPKSRKAKTVEPAEAAAVETPAEAREEAREEAHAEAAPAATAPAEVAPATATGEVAPATATGEVAPATATGEVAPATATGEVAPATATGEVAPATATDEVAPATAPGEVAPATATGEVAPAQASMAGQQVVYVQAPLPPRVRGNRVVGVLLALLGAVIFAGVYALVGALIIDLQSGDLFGPAFGAFLGNAFFWAPGLVFLVGLVLLVLILNRAGWWTHVIGSLILAIAVYFGTIGALLVIANVFHGSPQVISFAQLAVNPFVIAAALVAREVSIWIGLAIAARGRRVKDRNVETRSAWDREQEEKKAEYERTGTAPAA